MSFLISLADNHPLALPSDYIAGLVDEGSDPHKTESSDDVVAIATIPQPALKDETQCQWLFHGSTKAKVLNAPGYPARIPKPSRPDLYHVRSTPEMGAGLFAKRDIKRGEIFLAERPLLVAPVRIGKVQQSDQYTESQLQKMWMSEFEMLLECAVGHFPNQSQADFRALHNAHTINGSGPLFGIVRSNSYTIGNLYDGPDDAPTCTYAAVCKIGSRINHRYVPPTHLLFCLLTKTWLLNNPSVAYPMWGITSRSTLSHSSFMPYVTSKPESNSSTRTAQSMVTSQCDKPNWRHMVSYANVQLVLMPPLQPMS